MQFDVTPANYIQFLKFMTHRKDAHAIQGTHGRYRKILAPIRDGDYVKHLKGDMTIGTYQIAEDCVRWSVWDVDGHEGNDTIPIEIVRERASELITKLQNHNIPHLLAESSPGSYHIWLLFDPPAPAFKAYHFMREIGGNDIETFPKQDHVEKGGYGNLVRLPLGIHQKKKQRYHYINDEFYRIDEFRVQTLDLSDYEPKVKQMKPTTEALPEDETIDDIFNRVFDNPKRIKNPVRGGIPPCLSAALENNLQLVGGGGHYMRVAIVCAYRDAGLPFAALCRLFTGQEDYDQVETAKQVRSVLKKEGGYSYSCWTLREKCSRFIDCKNCPRGRGFK